MKRNIFFGSVVLLTIICCIAFTFQGNAQKTAQQNIQPTAEGGRDTVPAEPILSHEERTAKIIESLKGQTLDETFIGLLDDRQYHYPGYLHGALFKPVNLHEIFSTRSFLKIFQQFALMPREQAIIKLKEFSERAIKEFDIALLNSLAKNANPSLVTQKSGSTIMSAKYMVCVTMLLAARLGEHELLLNQVEKMQPFIEAHINNIDSVRPPEIRGVFSPEVSRKIASLEDDCILSVLIYACEQAQIDWNWLFYRTCSC